MVPEEKIKLLRRFLKKEITRYKTCMECLEEEDLFINQGLLDGLQFVEDYLTALDGKNLENFNRIKCPVPKSARKPHCTLE